MNSEEDIRKREKVAEGVEAKPARRIFHPVRPEGE
jgi:hypothetical protein